MTSSDDDAAPFLPRSCTAPSALVRVLRRRPSALVRSRAGAVFGHAPRASPPPLGRRGVTRWRAAKKKRGGRGP